MDAHSANTVCIISLIIITIAAAMIIAGLYVYYIYVEQDDVKPPWYMYFLLISGAIILAIGLIMNYSVFRCK